MLPASLRGNIELRIDVAKEIWPIEVDVAELEMALLNIAVNARDAMPQGGTFDIDVRNSLPDGSTPERGPRRHQRCATAGSGIPSDVIGKVFDPFFTTKQPGAGTGLGLSQVYGFAQQSSGTVEPGQHAGAWHHYYDAASALRQAAACGKPRRTRLRALARVSGSILLVEDNPQVADVTAQTLTTMGFRVEVVDRARKALRPP